MEKQQWRKNYLTILSGQTVSLIGSSAVQFALIWWLTNESKSAIMLSVAGLSSYLPQLFLGPFVGVWLDRLKRKYVVIFADLFMGLVAMGLSLWFLFGNPGYLVVIAALFLRSLANVFHTPSIQKPSCLCQCRRRSWSKRIAGTSFYSRGPSCWDLFWER